MVLKGTRLARLRDEVAALRMRWSEHGESTPAGDEQALRGLASAGTHLDAAEEAARRRDLQRGWHKLHRAREAMACVLDGGELRREADDLLLRAQGLDDARRRLLKRWLGPGLERMPLAERRRTLRRALALHNEHWDVRHHAARMVGSRLRGLSGILMAATAGAIAAAAYGAFELVPGVPGGTFVAIVVLLGLLGGSVSALVSTLTGSAERILPTHLVDGSWNLLRAPFGGASALLVVLALGGGLLGVQPQTTQAYYVWAAVAGFSEGLFVRIAALLAGRLGGERPPPERSVSP